MEMPFKCRAASCLVESPFSASVTQEAARACRHQLGGKPDLVFAFVTSNYRERLSEFLEALQIDGHATSILGGSTCGLFGVGAEFEDTSGFSLLFLKLPQTDITVSTNVSKEDVVEGVVALLNPLSFNRARSLSPSIRETGTPTVGACVTGGPGAEDLYLFTEAGLSDADALYAAFSGRLRLKTFSAPGCRPIGDPLVVTASRENEILSLGQREPFAVLEAAFANLGEELQQEASGHIFAGIAIEEETSQFRSGDFHIQQIISATLEDGRLWLETPVRTGQTLQFQWRDPLAAEMEFRAACESVAEKHRPFASLLFAGKDRTSTLFGVADRNISVFEESFGNIPLAGFHSFGELVDVGDTSILQRQSVCGALFCEGEGR